MQSREYLLEDSIYDDDRVLWIESSRSVELRSKLLFLSLSESSLLPEKEIEIPEDSDDYCENNIFHTIILWLFIKSQPKLLSSRSDSQPVYRLYELIHSIYRARHLPSARHHSRQRPIFIRHKSSLSSGNQDSRCEISPMATTILIWMYSLNISDSRYR